MEEKLIQIMPGGAWVAWFLDEENNAVCRMLTAWGLSSDGNVVPLLVDQDGIVGNATDLGDFITITVADEDGPSDEMIAEAKDRVKKLTDL